MILHVDELSCFSHVLFVNIFRRTFDNFISMKFLIAEFLLASPFILTIPFINFGDFNQSPYLSHPSLLLFWQKFASLTVYFILPLYLKFESTRIIMHRGSYYDSVLAIETKNKFRVFLQL